MNDFVKRRDAHYAKGNNALANRIEDERRMASGLVRACLAKGYLITVDNGEDRPIRKSGSYRAIMDVLWQTDEEYVTIHDPDGLRRGCFFLVYGNSGEELICDYTDNEACHEINRELEPLAAKLAR
jgi:hypothetical protein